MMGVYGLQQKPIQKLSGYILKMVSCDIEVATYKFEVSRINDLISQISKTQSVYHGLVQSEVRLYVYSPITPCLSGAYHSLTVLV